MTRKTLVLVGSLLLIGAVLPAASAHWGPGEGQSAVTDGTAGRVVGFAGSAVVGTGGSVAGAASGALCDLEVGDVTGGFVPGVTTEANEAEIEENSTGTGSVADNTWDDGGSGAVCHTVGYAVGAWNTQGCAEKVGENTGTRDQEEARANDLVFPVFVDATCNVGSVSSNQDPVGAALGAAGCSVNRVFEQRPGTIPACVAPLLSPPPAGYSSCQLDASADHGNFGYATPSRGPAFPTKWATQAAVGGGLSCSGTAGTATAFVFENVDLQKQQVSGPSTTDVWSI